MRRSIVQQLVKSFGVALCWATAALLSISYTRQGLGLAIIWPANAILLATLLIADRRNHPLHVGAVLIASCCVNLIVGRAAAIAVPFAVIGVGEAVLAVWLIVRFSPVDRLFDSPANIFRFTLAALLACVPFALLAGVALMLVKGQNWWEVALNWLPSHVFGLLIFTPLLLIINQSFYKLCDKGLPKAKFYSALAMFGLVAAVTTLVFRQTSYSLAFLVVPALLAATFHLRAAGAAGSVVIVATIGSYFIIEGAGPFALNHASISERTYVMETFIAAMFLCALPLAAVLNERDRLAADTAQHLSLVRGIADRIGEVLFRIDDRDRWVYLNSAYRAVTGHDVASSLGRSIFDELPDADHGRVMTGLVQLRTNQVEKFSFVTKMVDSAGADRHIEFDMFRAIVASEDGRAISGVIRDITARTLFDEQLRRDAAKAVRAAKLSERAARTDDLTNLPNRRAFFERLELKLAEGDRFALAVFDIDHFKRINDSYGHPAGDEVLRRIAAVATAGLRERDMIARIGGEEFAILIEGEDSQAAASAADRMIHAVARKDILLSSSLAGTPEDTEIRVTISMGLAHPGTGDDAAKLLADADRALYAAKHGGRNQLRIAAGATALAR